MPSSDSLRNPLPPPPPPPVAPAAVRPAPVPVASPPPVRSPESIPVTGNPISGGLGSAKGIRWRGELGELTTHGSISDENGSEQEPHDESETPSDPLRPISDRVTRGAPPWLVSLVIHLLVLLLLALVTTSSGNGIGRIVLSIGQAEVDKRPELSEFSLDTELSPLDLDSQADALQSIEVPEVFEEISLADTQPIEMDEVTESSLVRSRLGMLEEVDVPKMFRGRSGAMKQALLSIYGGTTETQDAVELGLKWLKRNQLKNGLWGMRGPYKDGAFSENHCAATAMALIAFLGDGHTHQQGDYQYEVNRGMRRLVKLQNRSGFFAEKSRSHERMYAQAQATIAICEMYAMTKDSWLRPYAQSAIDFAQLSQSKQGGWRYQANADSDTSVTGWFVMALQSGRSAGLEVDPSVLAAADRFLDKVAISGGAGYSYEIHETTSSPAMTAEGLLCRQYLSWKRDHPMMQQGITALLEQAPFSINDANVYYWYYATQALHHYGGRPWQEWNESMRVDLPKAQIKEGRDSGSWAPQGDLYGDSYGRLYTTCLSLYCLEVYYRHMPLYASDAQ